MKFTEAASKWAPIKQECFGLFFGVKYFSYFLVGMTFILETDHSNLLWIEQSIVPMIIRWRIYLQCYNHMKRYIKGSTNVVSDLGSRQVSDSNAMQNLNHMSPASDILQLVHGGRRGHPGVRETYNRINIEFPGHGLSHSIVKQYVEECPTCQKARLGLTDCFAAKVLSLPASHQRVAVGVDTVTVTPTDKAGNCCIVVVVFLNSKLAWLWPAKDHSAETLAIALFNFFCRHGLCDEIRSDPGSDLTSEVVAQVHAWFGIKHVFSLVDRHESNGVEGTNKQILRHLRALVADERVNRIWSDPSVLPLVEYMINSDHRFHLRLALLRSKLTMAPEQAPTSRCQPTLLLTAKDRKPS